MSTSPRPRRFLTLPQICDRYEVSDKTPRNWVRRGYVTLYKCAGELLLDVDEVDAALKLYGPTKMRDGRRHFGQTAKPVPVEAVKSEAVES